MDLLVIKEYDLREKYRFLVACLTLSALMDLKKGNGNHLLKLLVPRPSVTVTNG